MLYSVGDIVGLSAEIPNIVRFVGQIMNIWNIMEPHEVQCVDINWYYTKGDLPIQLRLPCISESEVFPSDITTSIYAANIVRKIRILSEKVASEMASLSPDQERMSRAKFVRRTMEFDPPAEEWQRSCVCREPVNLDLEYVQCDKCQDWLHNQPECTGMTQKEVEETESFVCRICLKK